MKTIYYLFFLLSLFPFFIGILSIIFFTVKNNKSKMPLKALLIHSVSLNKKRGISYLKMSIFENFLFEINQRGLKTCSLSEAIEEYYTYDECKSIPLIFDDGFKDFYTNAYPLLKKYNFTATIYPVSNTLLNIRSSWDIYSNSDHLNASEIREISDSSFEIGSHTASHPDLTRLPIDIIVKELKESKISLEACTGKSVNSISFPFGSWNENIWSIAQKLGYKSATAYRNHSKCRFPIIPAVGVYSFDTVDTIFQKIGINKLEILTTIKSNLIPHFAKGSSLWSFRKSYLK